MLRTLLRAFTILIAFMLPASAQSADLKLPKTTALTAPVITPATCTQNDCSGPYFTGSIASVGGLFMAGAGYQLWNGQYFAAIEGNVGYQTSGANGGQQMAGNIVGLEQIKLGAALQGLLGGATPAPAQGGQAPTSLPLPAQLSQAFMAPYFAVGSMQRPHASVMVSGVGAEFLLASAWTLDAEYLYAPPMSSDGASNVGRISLQYHFK